MQSMQSFSVGGYPSVDGPHGGGVYGRHLTVGAPPSYRNGPAVGALSLSAPNLAADTVSLRISDAIGNLDDYQVGTIVNVTRQGADQLAMRPTCMDWAQRNRCSQKADGIFVGGGEDFPTVLVSRPIITHLRSRRETEVSFACTVTVAVQNAATVRIPKQMVEGFATDLKRGERFYVGNGNSFDRSYQPIFGDNAGPCRSFTVLEEYDRVLGTMRCDLGMIYCV